MSIGNRTDVFFIGQNLANQIGLPNAAKVAKGPPVSTFIGQHKGEAHYPPRGKHLGYSEMGGGPLTFGRPP